MSHQWVAFLRGINVGGKHKLPMGELRDELEKQGFESVQTLLNSGNVLFCTAIQDASDLENRISKQLEQRFGFPVPVLLRSSEQIKALLALQPFKNTMVSPDTRLYVTFLPKAPGTSPTLPWVSDDGAFRILHLEDNAVSSVLDLSVSKTTKGMDALERLFGRAVTTRNWNTIEKIGNLI